MLKMKFIKKELVNWFNIHGDNVIFLIVKLALLLLLKFYIIDALVLHWFL